MYYTKGIGRNQDWTINNVVVELTHTFRVGSLFNISPSEGFLGIEDGVVQITAIQPLELLQKEEYYSTLGDPEVLLEIDPDVADELWITYKYIEATYTDINDLYAIPLGMFLVHTSARY